MSRTQRRLGRWRRRQRLCHCQYLDIRKSSLYLQEDRKPEVVLEEQQGVLAAANRQSVYMKSSFHDTILTAGGAGGAAGLQFVSHLL